MAFRDCIERSWIDIDELLDRIVQMFLNILLIFILVLMTLLLSYYMMLKNITVKICKEAEITGVITSSFVESTYQNNPLSKIPGAFRIEEISPGLDRPSEHLGEKLSIKITKEITISGHTIELSAKTEAINQGFYANGYRTD